MCCLIEDRITHIALLLHYNIFCNICSQNNTKRSHYILCADWLMIEAYKTCIIHCRLYCWIYDISSLKAHIIFFVCWKSNYGGLRKGNVIFLIGLKNYTSSIKSTHMVFQITLSIESKYIQQIKCSYYAFSLVEYGRITDCIIHIMYTCIRLIEGLMKSSIETIHIKLCADIYMHTNKIFCIVTHKKCIKHVIC